MPEKAAHVSQRATRRGRPTLMPGGSVNVNVRMTPEQREKLEQLGGAAWIRERIERAYAALTRKR